MRQRLELTIHLSGCSICRLFQRQSRWINHIIRTISHSPAAPADRLGDDFKQQLQQKINERLK